MVGQIFLLKLTDLVMRAPYYQKLCNKKKLYYNSRKIFLASDVSSSSLPLLPPPHISLSLRQLTYKVTQMSRPKHSTSYGYCMFLKWQQYTTTYSGEKYTSAQLHKYEIHKSKSNLTNKYTSKRSIALW